MILFYMISFLTTLDLALCCLYSFARKKWDHKKSSDTNAAQELFPHKGIKYRLIKPADTWLYGLVWWSSLWVGHIPSHRIRNFLYKYIFHMNIHRKAVIYGGCELRSPWNITIGNSTIAARALLDGRNGILIEDNVVFGTGVWLWTEQHAVDDPYFRCLSKGGPIVVKKRAWICSRSTILPNTVIGEGAVVASGAVISKDCLPHTMYGGVPAKEIRKRNPDLKYENVTDCCFPFF